MPSEVYEFDRVVTADGQGAWWARTDDPRLITLDAIAKSDDIIKALGLDKWTVDKQEVYFTHAKHPGKFIRAKAKPMGGDGSEYFALVRSDNGDVFASGVTDAYEPRQYAEDARFIDEVVGVRDAIYHTAGTLKNGRVFWVLAKLPLDLELKNGDRFENYILLSNSLDTSTSWRMKLTMTRVICNNTLSWALGERGAGVARRHTRNINTNLTQQVAAFRKQLGLVEASIEMKARELDLFATQVLETGDAMALTRDLFGISEEKEKEGLRAPAANNINDVMNLFNRGTGNNGETMYDWLNGVTEFADHRASTGREATRGDEQSFDIVQARAFRSMFGSGDQLKDKAVKLLTKVCVERGVLGS